MTFVDMYDKLDKEVKAAREDKQVYVVLPFEVAEFALGIATSVRAGMIEAKPVV